MGHLFQAARRQLVDVRADPGHAQAIGDHQQRDGQRPQHRPRQPGRNQRDERGAGLLGDAVQRGTFGADCSQPATAPGRLGRDGQRLRGGARAGHRDDRVGRADPARQPLGLGDHHLDRAAEPGHGVEHLARQARTAHARHDDGARPGVRGRRPTGRSPRTTAARCAPGPPPRLPAAACPRDPPPRSTSGVSSRSAARTKSAPPQPSRSSLTLCFLGAWPLRPAAPGCRHEPGRPGRRWRWCTRARWPPRRPAAARGIPGRPGCQGASHRCA